MKIGLIDVDSHNFPNLALMKISAFHKAQGDTVEWCEPFYHYDIVYQCKVFGDTYSDDIAYIPQADKIIKGGTGYAIEVVDGREIYHPELDKPLPSEIEHQYPDYSIYPELTKDTAALPTKEQAQMKRELVAFNTALDALNRLNPKRPTQADSHVKALDVENNKVVTFRCSRCVCGKYIVQNANNKFCQHCGQALDWGDAV